MQRATGYGLIVVVSAFRRQPANVRVAERAELDEQTGNGEKRQKMVSFG